MKNSSRHWRVLIIGACCLLAACGGGGGGMTSFSHSELTSALANRSVNPAPPSTAKLQELTSQLEQELQALGKDVSSTATQTPSDGNQPLAIQPELLDADGNGQTPPYGVKLGWVERLLGDYDQNGLVNVADLTSLGQYLGYKVVYDSPELHNGQVAYPAGDPSDYGADSDGITPQPDSGAFNWRLARIDGDGNGEIGLSDLTVIAQHWQESLSGYIAYVQDPAAAEFSPIANSVAPESTMTIRRVDVMLAREAAGQQFSPVMYSVPDFYLLDPPVISNVYNYKVAAFNSETGENGPESDPVSVAPFTSETNNNGIIPALTAEVQTPEQSLVALGATSEIVGTAPLTIRFDASGSYVPAGNLVNYLWDFEGDGVFEASSGDDPHAVHTYTDNARFDATVKLLMIEDPTAKGASGIRSSSSIKASGTTSISIVTLNGAGNHPPLAQCLANPPFGAAPLTVQFNAGGSTDEDNAITHYEWDFDNDGVADFASETPQATFTFGTSALSRVRLKVIDAAGGYDSQLIPVITSNQDGNWPPSAELQVNPTLGSAPLNVTLDASGSTDPDGSIVSYEWDLNGDFNFDVNTGANAAIDYVFTESGIYNIWLRVTDTDGQFDLVRSLVNVNTAPFTGLEATPEAGTGPLTVTFDASSSQDLDGTIVKYEWDFDSDGVYDKDTGILPRVTQTFYKVGTFTVTMRATDNLGFTSTQSLEITVRAPKNNLTPTISLTASTNDGAPPLSVTLTAVAADPDVDGGIDHYTWDFEGDGIWDLSTDVLGTERTFEYSVAGRYHPAVSVVDVAGGSAIASVDVLVHQPGNDPPVASFTVNPLGSPPGTPVSFNAGGSSDDNGIVDFAWDFDGDGSFDVNGVAATAESVQHTYSVLGNYHAVLKVTDANGAVAFAWQNIVVGEVPELTIVADRGYTELPNGQFNLDASRSQGVEGDITNFEWDLDGDGIFELSTGVSPFATAEFQLPDLLNHPGGSVTLRLRATNEIGATAVTNVVSMPARDPATGEPLRDGSGNLVLDESGQVLLQPVGLLLQDKYDEVEDNDDYLSANFLIGPQSDGSFGPTAAGDRITAVKPGQFTGAATALTRNDGVLGDYVAGSLGELNLGTTYDGDDNDWFAFELAEGAHVHADLTFLDKSKTDLNLRLYAANGVTPVAQSLSTDHDEALDYNFRDPGVYYIRVNRFVGEGQDYKLALVATPIAYFPEGTVTARWDGGTKDAGTNNDPGGDPVLSAGLADDFQTTILDPKLAFGWGSIDKATDPEDWYYFQYSSAITTRIDCRFSHAEADIDLLLYDQDLNLLGYSNSADDDETIIRPLPAPGGTKRLFVRVQAHGGGPANYTLSIGYPAGQPLNLDASDGSSTGQINISWSPPAPGGNTPNGYALYYSDSELGYYTLLADQLTATSFVHNLSATANWPLQNQAYWYKVKATITGEQDSEFSNTDSGYCNGVKPPVGLNASDSLFLDHVLISFYDSPADPALGTGNFGLPPLRYELYADPAGGLPETLIATFYPGDGEPTVVPPLGGQPSRDGERFELNWTGLPNWSANQLQGVSTTFRVVAYNFNNYLLPAHQSAQISDNGAIAGLSAPTNFTATNGLFAEQIRVSWTDYSSQEPDGYILQFQGEYDSGWTNLTNQPIPHSPGDSAYDYYVTGAGGSVPASGKFRIRSLKDGIGYSPWTNSNYGYASNNTLQPPIYGMNWWTENHDGHYDVKVSLGTPPLGTIVPQYWRYRFYRGSWYDWRSYNYFNRESVTRIHSSHYTLSYSAVDTRAIEVEVLWTDPSDSSFVLTSTYTLLKVGTLPINP